MAVGYKYREIVGFPNLRIGQEWLSTTQLAMTNLVDNSSKESSLIRLLGDSEHPSFRKYFVHHETVWLKKVKFEDKIRTSVTAIEDVASG